MLPALMGVPGKLASIIASLASYLDAAVSTRAPASTALSTANWTTARAAQLDNAAQETNPLLAAPKAGGLTVGNLISVGSAIGLAGNDGLGSLAESGGETVSTTFVDVVNYTGAGVLEFFAASNFLTGGSVAASYEFEIIVDGATVLSYTFGGSGAIACPVGSINGLTYPAQPGALPFKASIQIHHKVSSGAGYGGCCYKMRKTA